jgi:hypothetical protein
MLTLHHTPEEFRISDFGFRGYEIGWITFDLQNGLGEYENGLLDYAKFEIRNPKSEILLHPFTQTTCLISATTVTRSFWFFITASIDL